MGCIIERDYLRKYKGDEEHAVILNCVPSLDPRFGTNQVIWDVEGGQDLHVVSRWSERHAAFASGLGTFGLTRAIITERGCAGRFASILTELPLAPTPRKYTSVYGNCIRCGACADRCPVNAISLGQVKNNLACKARVNETGKRYAPRYGCGKCQTRYIFPFCDQFALILCDQISPAGSAVRSAQIQRCCR